MSLKVRHGENTAEDALVVAIEEATKACKRGNAKDASILEKRWKASDFALQCQTLVEQSSVNARWSYDRFSSAKLKVRRTL